MHVSWLYPSEAISRMPRFTATWRRITTMIDRYIIEFNTCSRNLLRLTDAATCSWIAGKDVLWKWTN